MNETKRYWVRTDRVREIIDRQHYSQDGVAREVGVSRQYWSRLFNRRRPLSTAVRRRMLSAPVFQQVPESDLWEITAEGGVL